MKASLRKLILGGNIALLFAGLLMNYRPMKGVIGDIFYNQVVSNVVNSDFLDVNNVNLLIFTTQIDPLNNEAHYLLAAHYFSEGDYLNSIKQLKAFVEIDPTSSDAFMGLGDSYWEIGELDLAIDQYKKAAQLDPANLELLQYLSKKYDETGRLLEQFNTLYAIATLSSDSQERLSASNELSKISVEISSQLALAPGIPLGFGRQSSAALGENSKLYLLSRSHVYPNMIVITTSPDYGKTWDAVRALYVGIDLDGALTIDSKGIVHLVYGDKNGKLIYTNSQSDFESSVVITEHADARQIAVSDDGIVHLVWVDPQSNVWHQEIKDSQILSEAELISKGRFPSLAVSKNSVFVTYNSSVVFPNSDGRVYFIEKKGSEWLPSVIISADHTWSGASALAIDRNGIPYVIYIEDSKPVPKLIIGTRNRNGKWKIMKLDDVYSPYIPNIPGLPFGGRASPSVTVFGEDVYFLWRSNASESPIVIRVFNFSTEVFSSEMILGELWDAPFNNSPSFVTFQSSLDSPLVLWPEDGHPVFKVPQ